MPIFISFLLSLIWPRGSPITELHSGGRGSKSRNPVFLAKEKTMWTDATGRFLVFLTSFFPFSPLLEEGSSTWDGGIPIISSFLSLLCLPQETFCSGGTAWWQYRGLALPRKIPSFFPEDWEKELLGAGKYGGNPRKERIGERDPVMSVYDWHKAWAHLWAAHE